MKKFNIVLTAFAHRVSVFATPFVLAGALAVEQGIRNGSLNVGDYKAIGVAFASGVVIAGLNWARSQTGAPTPPVGAAPTNG